MEETIPGLLLLLLLLSSTCVPEQVLTEHRRTVLEMSTHGICRNGNRVDCCWGWTRESWGQCRPVCELGCKHGECVGPDQCRCHQGYTGKTCNQDVNECGLKPRPCKHRCMNMVGSYKCFCLTGYMMTHDGTCRNTRTCAMANCQYGCAVMKGEVMCQCPSPGLQLGPDRRTCVDIDECAMGVAKCPRFRKCVNTFGSYICKCHKGFELRYINGKYHCTDKNNPCNEKPDSKKCKCKPGTRGWSYDCKFVITVTVNPARPFTTPRPTTKVTKATSSPPTTTKKPIITTIIMTTTTSTATSPTTTTTTTTSPTTTSPTTTATTTTTTTSPTTTTTTTTSPTTTTTTTTSPTTTTTTTTSPTTTTTPTTSPTTTTTTSPTTGLTSVSPTTVATTVAATVPTTRAPTTVVMTTALTTVASTAATTVPTTKTPTTVAMTTAPITVASTTPTMVGKTTMPTTVTMTTMSTTVAMTTMATTTALSTTVQLITTTLDNFIREITQRPRGDVHIPRNPEQNVFELDFDDIELGNTADFARDDPSAGSLSCSFDQGLCSWMMDRDGDLHWETVADPHGGQYLSVPEPKTGRHLRGARLTIPLASPTSPARKGSDLCLSFRHRLQGLFIGFLQVFVKKRWGHSPAVWTRTSGQEWRHTQITLSERDIESVVFKAERRKGRSGEIAIDDMSIHRGVCRNRGQV